MNTTEKLTKRATFEMIKDLAVAAKDVNFDTELDYDYLVEFCDKEIAALDKKAEKARETAAKKKAEGDALLETVYNVLSDTDFESIADIVEKVVEVDETATAGKVQYRLTALVKDERAEKSQIVIPATEDAKKRTIVGYRKVVG